MRVDDLQWRKSTWSSTELNCVEVAFAGDEVLARDSKDRDGHQLVVSSMSWGGFVQGLRRGHFDREIN